MIRLRGISVFTGRWVIAVLLFLPRMWVRLRRTMTTTSITLLLACIVSMNVVWGYPWLGMFAACVAIATIAGATCWIFRPSLRVDIKLPLSARATEPFQTQIHLTNRRRLPALDLSVGFDPLSLRISSYLGRHRQRVDASAAKPMNLIRAQGHAVTRASLCYARRGIYTLPPVLIESSFPFYVFRIARRIKVATSIAITPLPLGLAEASLARTMLQTIEQLSSRINAGDSLEYTGSREYQVGVSVRRWDFGSWARLGRPIVREFQSSALQTVWLFVDTCAQPGMTRENSENHLERLLSCAAAVIPEWLNRRVRLRLYVTSEVPSSDGVQTLHGSVSDGESLFIRLAAADFVENDVARERLSEMFEFANRNPVLLLTARDSLPLAIDIRSNCHIVRCHAVEILEAAV